jgi:general stress protein 26
MTLFNSRISADPNAAGYVEPISAERVWEIMKGIDIAMLVTVGPDGMRGRPMSTIPVQEKGLIYALTEVSTAAVDDIRADDEVFLSYQGRGDHVALQGRARIDTNPVLLEQLWSPGAQAFWPKGPQAHGVVVIVIDPGHADVWDGKGMLSSLASLVKGVVTGKSPDLGTRGAADL